VSGASLANLRIVGTGFRFELILEPDFQVTGLDLLGLDGRSPGEYLAENNGQSFTIQPLGSAQLSMEARRLGQAGSGWVIVHNNGMGDSAGLALVTEIVRANGEEFELARQPVEVQSGQSTAVQFDPPEVLLQDMALRARLEDAQGQTLMEIALPAGEQLTSLALAQRGLGISTAGGYLSGWLLALPLFTLLLLAALRRLRMGEGEG